MDGLAVFLEDGRGWVDHLYEQKCEYERDMADQELADQRGDGLG